MVNVHLAPTCDFGPWSIENLRLSLFHTRREQQPELWAKVGEREPDSIDTKPREGVTQVRGEVDNNLLLLVSQAERTDWNLLPVPQRDPAFTSELVVKDSRTTQLLQSALAHSLKTTFQVTRLAYGAVLSQPVKDNSEALRKLAEYLPDLNLSKKGHGLDFSYQINRTRRAPSAHFIEINRLARWQVERTFSGSLHITMGSGARIEESPASLNIRLILDINSAPTSSAIGSERFPTLLINFMDMASEIAHKGDIA